LPEVVVTPEELVCLVTRVADEVAQLEGVILPPEFGPETPLFGDSGLFDSLGLVSLVLAVEEAVADESGVPVSLADERAMSQARSPFRTVRSLAEYAAGLIEEGVAESA
jgi:D-alanine--poly(phosphoribitol) ligase subunit 2